jgi:DNA gyrase subunit B
VPATTDTTYSARHLSVLEGLEAVRKRPGMYIGSTDSRGLSHCAWEIIDNAVDEALAEHCDAISVVLHADGSVAVSDNGRGIPVDTEPRTGLSGIEVVFTKLHAGGKFGGGSYVASGGLHGVGASVVNALSARLDVEVDRQRTHRMSFRRGEPGVFTDTDRPSPESPFAPFVDHSELVVGRRVKKGTSGTRVRFWPDRQIFLPEAQINLADMLDRARQTAFLIPGLRITIRDEREDPPHEEVFQHTGGIADFVEHCAPDQAHSGLVRITGSEVFTETVPSLDAEGHLVSQEMQRECVADVALRWGTGYDATVRSFVNVITTPKGGTHLAGFEQGLLKSVRSAVKQNARRLKAGEEKIEKEDVLEGLTAVVTVRLAEPQFEGQTKEVLGTAAVRGITARVVSAELDRLFSSTRRADKQETQRILEKIVTAARTRRAARLHKETVRRKNALETSALPAKLVDCRSDDVDSSELFIVEGDSALGTAKLARDSRFQALLPIRGKILNVQKASVTDMLKNAECASIIQVIGAGSGRTFDLDLARYGKVIILSDADVDGAHIRTLLITLFFRYMRPLVDAGRLYAAMPPLHRLELVNPKKGQPKVTYTYTDSELAQTMKQLRSKGVRWKEPVQRYKGLGEMDADQLAETTMDRGRRTLRRVSLTDADLAEQTFALLMGSEVAPRREFIVDSSLTLDRAQIDA